MTDDDKDAPLREDIRLVGRLLGEVVRTQEGGEIFALVEQVRKLGLRFHRDEDPTAREELEDILSHLSRGGAIQTIRAFSYFSHLANICEDQHHIRRTRRARPGLSQARRGASESFFQHSKCYLKSVTMPQPLLLPPILALPQSLIKQFSSGCLPRLLRMRDFCFNR